MAAFLVGLAIGLLVGSCCGILVMALAVTAARSDKAVEDHLAHLGD